MKRKARQQGSTLVESALSLFLLLMLVFGIIEFGRLFNVYQVMTNSAREGARYAVAPLSYSVNTTTPLPTTSDVQTYVQGFLSSGAVWGATPQVGQDTLANLNVTLPCGSGTALPPVGPASVDKYTRVKISLPFTFNFFRYTPTIVTCATMRNENN